MPDSGALAPGMRTSSHGEVDRKLGEPGADPAKDVCFRRDLPDNFVSIAAELFSEFVQLLSHVREPRYRAVWKFAPQQEYRARLALPF